ncbi:MAG: carboxypeptidase-like regulatory domain-containing protein [Candidatus Omnitrophota bacterium]
MTFNIRNFFIRHSSFVIRHFFLFSLLILYFPITAAAADLAGYAAVSGQVKDNITKIPMPDVKIRLKCGTNQQETFTNASGFYEFLEIPIYQQGDSYQNKTQIFTFAREYITEIQQTELLPGETYVFDFRLDTRFKYPIVQGQVTDSVSFIGIAEATVTVSNETQAYSSVTDGDGYYQIRVENKGVGEYSVQAAADDYLKSEPQSVKTFPLKTYTINFSLEKTVLGVSVFPDSWQLGEVELNTVTVMSQGEEITVTNTGDTNETYSLSVINPPVWSASSETTGAEQYILNACFASNPDIIIWNEPSHALTTEPQRATQTKFAADQTGADIAPNEQRTLWLQFKAPTRTSVITEQDIEVIINAELP